MPVRTINLNNCKWYSEGVAIFHSELSFRASASKRLGTAFAYQVTNYLYLKKIAESSVSALGSRLDNDPLRLHLPQIPSSRSWLGDT